MRKGWMYLMLALLVGFSACDDEDDPTGPATEFEAQLTGSAEVPPVTSSGSGSATLRVRGDSVLFTLTATNLTNVTAAHIHGPAPVGVPAGIIVGLFSAATDGPFPGTVTGSFKASDFADDQGVTTLNALLTLMRQGQTYVNVHTAANPGGEIRGQIEED